MTSRSTPSSRKRGGAARRRPPSLAFAPLLVALAACGAAPEEAAPSAPPQARPPAVAAASDPVEPAVEGDDERRKPVYGAVVTKRGDPVPMASLHWGEERLGFTNTYGEFAVFVPFEAGDLAISHPEFAVAVEHVEAGHDAVERLVTLPLRPPLPRDDAMVFLLQDPSWRGVPGARVRLVDRDSRVLLLETESRYDGSVVWPGKRKWHGRVEVRVRRAGWPRDDTNVWRVAHGKGISVNTTMPREPEHEVVVESPQEYGGQVRVSLFSETGHTVSEGYAAARCSISRQGGFGALWALARGERRASFRRLVPGTEAGTFVAPLAAGVARLVIERDDAQLDVYPHLHVVGGRPWVLDGSLLGDMQEAPHLAPASVRLAARGTDLVSPLLDVGPCSLSLRPGPGERDLRTFARLPDTEHLASLDPGVHTFAVPLFVVEGTGVVRARFHGDATGPCEVVLARRGGGYSDSRMLRSGMSVEWRGLCAGAFMAWRTMRPEPGGSGTPVDGTVVLPKILVGPGQVTNILVPAPQPDEAAGATLRTKRER